jgi:hypothetical protein
MVLQLSFSTLLLLMQGNPHSVMIQLLDGSGTGNSSGALRKTHPSLLSTFPHLNLCPEPVLVN